uniref:Uncharacterized protein n=1 Tax=Oryza rufipogon TaxID=4529 RepID=A0A0E0PZ27_ORYRU
MELEAVVVFPWTLLSCPAVLTVVARLPRQMSPVVRRTTQPFLRNRSEKLSRTFLPWSLKVSRSYAMAASSAVLKVSRVVKLLRWWQDREQLCRSNGGGT